MPIRAAFYIDGFNLYHAIDDLGQPHLKWLNLWALSASLIPQKSEQLVRVVWCTAIRTDDTEKMLRHRALIKALRLSGVTCMIGHFANEPKSCHSCGRNWQAPTEKQGDVNLAIALIDDAHRDMFDHAYLVTADGDQAAAAALFKARFPQRRITNVAPVARSHNKLLLSHCDGSMTLRLEQIERALFSRGVTDGAETVVRPARYDPPAGWIHPNARPGRQRNSN